MKKYSLYTILFASLVLLGIIFAFTVYFFLGYQREELIKTAIREKINLAETIEKTMFSSIWKFRISPLPGVENIFISQMSQFQDVVFLRIVGLDGTIKKSSAANEVGKFIEDPDISRVIVSGEAAIKDMVYDGQKIKLVIHPAPLDNTVWVGFSLNKIEEVIRGATIQYIIIGLTSAFFTLFAVYFILRLIINPIKIITAACRKIAAGDLGVEVRVESRTEIGELAVTFNEMVSDLKSSLHEIEEARKKTQTIIDSLADGLLVFDKDNKVSLANPQAEIILGIKATDIAGDSLSSPTGFAAYQSLAVFLGREVRKIFREELEIKENLILEITTVPLLAGGEKIGNLAVLHDVTREKVAERLKTEFVSLAAHQLRTPLSAIKWTLRMLLDGDFGKVAKEQEKAIERTYKSNERMIYLVNDLLDVTRIEEGRYLQKQTPASFWDIVLSAISAYKSKINKKRLKFKFETPKEELPLIMADAGKMDLAIQNLLDNAINYTPSGGEVTISLKGGKNEIEFSIKDTGIGIDESQRERIFTKFFRGANAVKMETEGSGLGLFIAKNIVEAHRGKIWFKSKGGGGSTFYFTIPYAENYNKKNK